jgi:putative NADPH-quinone reductase
VAVAFRLLVLLIWGNLMSKIMIVVGHPQRTTFCEAISHAYEKGALAAGHKAKLFMLSEMSFDA